MRSILSQRAARFAIAPARAATALTTTSVLLGEKSSATASSRLLSRTVDKSVSHILLQKRTVFSGTRRTMEGASKKDIIATGSAAPPEGASHPNQNGNRASLVGHWVTQVIPMLVDKTDEPAEPYDYARTGRAAFFGFALHAPLSHRHFNLLEWMTIRAGLTGLKIPVFKAFMEQFVYWSWLSNSLYHSAMGAMQGQAKSQIYDRIADVLWETQKAQCVFWIPIQLPNFRLVPVRHQLNVALLTSIVWTALLSAWHPPEREERKQPALENASL